MDRMTQKKGNVLLVAINAKYIHSNLAVHCLRAYAFANGRGQAQIDIAEYTINHLPDDILQDIYRRRPDMICFSCYIWNIEYIKELIGEFHKILPKCRIWLGGPEVSYRAKEFLEQFVMVKGVMLCTVSIHFYMSDEGGGGRNLYAVAG